MSWLEVRMTLPPEIDSSVFVDLYGAHGIESTLEEKGELIGAIANVAGADERVGELTAALISTGATEVQTQVLPETNWEEAWKQFFVPRRVGKHFVVRPTWEEFEALPDDLVIVLDPGQAFGTGDHPTTRLCLELMERSPIAGARVADVGCGSGILSVGACLLGATEVDAVDIEAISVEVAKENAARNSVTFRAVAGDGLAVLTGVYDVLLSNIISATLIRLSSDVPRYLRPGGHWIVSGVIHANWPDVQFFAEKAGFRLVEKVEEGDWVAACFLRP